MGHEALVEQLLAKDGVEPNLKDKDGRTPLAWASLNGKYAVVKLLLANDSVDLNCKDEDGQTPLALASLRGHNEVAGLLLAKMELIGRDGTLR
jgi:ankyrin repeat protein